MAEFLIRFSEFRPIVCRTPRFVYALPTRHWISVTGDQRLVPRPSGTDLSYQLFLV
jgi:hypothetical protein